MKISKYIFKLNLQENFHTYKISPKIRGILGYGLKKIYCRNYYQPCEDCEYIKNCRYMDIFKPVVTGKTNTVYNVIYTNKKEDCYYISITSIKNIITLRDISDSLVFMKSNGIGNKHLSYDIELAGAKEYEINDNWIEHRKKEFETDIWKLKFLSPYSTKYKQVDEKVIISSLINRVKFLDEQMLNKITENSKVYLEILDKKLKYVKNFKESEIGNRISLSGFKGELAVKINLEAYLLFKLAEIFHIGKNVAYGCGKVNLRRILC